MKVLSNKTGFFVLFLFFSMGCLDFGSSGSSSNQITETLLQPTEALRLNFRVLKTNLLPGGETFALLNIRNNALGNDAKNVIASLDGVDNWDFVDCKGNLREDDESMRDCSTEPSFQIYDLNEITSSKGTIVQKLGDVSLLSQIEINLESFESDNIIVSKDNGISNILKGQEFYFVWQLKAPDCDVLSCDEQIKYFVNFDYLLESDINVLLVSTDEENRLLTSGGSLPPVSPTVKTNGPLSLSLEKNVITFNPNNEKINEEIVVLKKNSGKIGVDNGLHDVTPVITEYWIPKEFVFNKQDTVFNNFLKNNKTMRTCNKVNLKQIGFSSKEVYMLKKSIEDPVIKESTEDPDIKLGKIINYKHDTYLDAPTAVIGDNLFVCETYLTIPTDFSGTFFEVSGNPDYIRIFSVVSPDNYFKQKETIFVGFSGKDITVPLKTLSIKAFTYYRYVEGSSILVRVQSNV